MSRGLGHTSLLEVERFGVKLWSPIHRYADRWTIERTFGAFKRMFHDLIVSTCYERMRPEGVRNIIACNVMMANRSTRSDGRGSGTGRSVQAYPSGS